MTMRAIWIVGLLCISLTIFVPFGQAQGPPGQAPPPGQVPPPGQAPPPAPKIPGINATDMFPHACVDCHLNYKEMNLDTRFSTLLKQWSEGVRPELLVKAQAAAPEGMTLKGKHPDAASALEDVPAKCLVCHGKGSKLAPAFTGMIHRIHMVGGDENHFMTLFQGECTHCHKLDLATGHWRIPSAPEK